MIGVFLEEDADDVQAFGKQFGIPFPVVAEGMERGKKMFGILGCPSAVLIDRGGSIIGRIVGDRDWRGEAARSLFRSLLGVSAPPAAQKALALPPPRRLHKAVHLVSAIRSNDRELTRILDEAASSLKSGDEVVILFDGQSVGALRMNARKQKKTPLEETPFATGERRALATRLGVCYSAAPRNQLEYVRHLARGGANVFVNLNSIRALGLENDEVHPLAKRVTLSEMAKMVDESDACFTYEGI